jgi:hypothetical protein
MSLTKVSYSMVNGAPVNVLDFGADPTGVADSTAAFQNAHDYCVSTGQYFGVVIPAGEYLQTARINWSPFVQVRTNGYVVMNITMASGFAWNISQQWGPKTGITGAGEQAYRILFVGGIEFKNSNATNTATCFLIGSDSTNPSILATSMVCLEGLSTFNFQGAVEIADHAYIITFKECHFIGSYDPVRAPSCNGLYSRARDLTDSGSVNFVNCTFALLGNACNTPYTNGRLYVYFELCEFGQCARIIGLTPSRPTAGEIFSMTDCYFESTFDFGTPACYINNNELHINNCFLYAGPYTYYDNPMFANATESGLITVNGFNLAMVNAPAVFISGDATSTIQASGFNYRLGTSQPVAVVTSIGNLNNTTNGNFLAKGNLTSQFAPATQWGLDYASSTSVPNLITIASGATFDLASGSGIVVLHSNTDGAGAVFFCYGGTVAKLGGDASYVAGGASAGEVGLFYNGGTSKYRIQNAKVASQAIFVTDIRTRLSV